MKKTIALAALSFFLLFSAGCGSSPAPQPTPQPDPKTVEPKKMEAKTPVPEKTPAQEIESWKLITSISANEAKAKAQFHGKPFIVKNILVYEVDPARNGFDAFAFDPSTKMISTTGQSKWNGQSLVASDDFFLEVLFAEPKIAVSMKNDGSKPTSDKKGLMFSRVLTVECTIDYQSGNLVSLKKAKIIKK